jgi:class 3 adenylate cyclase
MKPDVSYARNGKVAIAFEVLGDGPIDLVYLPGFINNLEAVWDNPLLSRFLNRLARFSRLVMIDRRGAGLSDRLSPDDLPPLEELSDDVNVVLDMLGSHRAAVFGSSDCGSLCAMFAATHPERTSALVLYATSARGSLAPNYGFTWSDEKWDRYLSELRAGWGTLKYARESLPFFDPSLAGNEQIADWYASFQRLAASPTSAEAIERIYYELDIRAILPTIGVPTLVLHRTEDPIEYVDAGRDIAGRIPGAKFVEVPGSDHHMWAGDQDALLDEIERFLSGVNSADSDLDRVLATVLFTDIAGSTQKAAELGDHKWRDLLDAHHSRVRPLLKHYRGLEVDTAGDGFLATFDGPARGVKCAGAIVESVREIGIEIRAGVHTGECELVEDKVRGIAVHIGARVAALARPGEVLVSSTVKDLVAGSGLRFDDRGVHALKGVPDEWRLYAVVQAMDERIL